MKKLFTKLQLRLKSGNMNILELCSILQLMKKEPISFADLGSVMGLSRQYVAKLKNDEVDNDKLEIVEKHYNVKIPRDFVLCERKNVNSSVFAIPYWEGCHECSDRLKRDDFIDLKLDIELINSWNVKPENLCIIAMPGEEMNGGEMPIANKDLLVIDISRNNPYESGVFFVTSHNCQRVYVRRLMETLNEKGQSVVFSTVDNEIYKKAIEKYWTKEMRTEADIKIIGRVITNATYTI